jgi:phosphatidylglycerophosphate synthase
MKHFFKLVFAILFFTRYIIKSYQRFKCQFGNGIDVYIRIASQGEISGFVEVAFIGCYRIPDIAEVGTPVNAVLVFAAGEVFGGQVNRSNEVDPQVIMPV